MKPDDLIIRCFAERKDGVWQAFCLNFDLAVQGESFVEVKEKIGDMIADYVFDALAGEDMAYAPQLLKRSAPLFLWAKYYSTVAQCKLSKFKKDR